MRNLAKRAEFRICFWASFFVSTFLSCYILLLNISVFSDFLVKKILVFSDFLVKKILVFSDFSVEKISVFSDFLAKKILVKLNYDVYLYSINGYKSVNL